MAQEGQLINSLQTLILDLPPSCIEFCPAYQDYFVVATYDLQKDDKEQTAEDSEQQEQQQQHHQTRNGSLVLFRLAEGKVAQIQTLEQPSAILDVHFHPSKTDVMAVVNSTGMLSFVRLSPSSNGHDLCLTSIVHHQPFGDRQDVLILSCCWHPSIPDIIAITTSSQEVHVLQLDEDWNIRPGESLVHTHQDQAWTAAFAPSLGDALSPKSFQVLSGGDDAKLLTNNCEYDGEHSWSALEDAKQVGRHDYGVTAILPLQNGQKIGEFILVTGSYDDHIRVYAADETPRLLAKVNLGGGVWRLKLIHLDIETTENGKWTATVLASCMYAGARVVRLSGSWYECKIEVLARFEEHQSMNYGSDFQEREDGKPIRIISTSFYDKRLCLWELP